MSRAAWIPAIPPPTTSAFLVMGIWVWESGSFRRMRAAAIRVRSRALPVATVRSRVHPGAVLPDVGHLRHEGIEAGLGDALAERRLVQARRAGRHHDPVQTVLRDGLAHQGLARLRAHVLVVARVHDAGHRPCLGGHPLHIYRLRDVGSTPTDEHARSCHMLSLHPIAIPASDSGQILLVAPTPRRPHLPRPCPCRYPLSLSLSLSVSVRRPLPPRPSARWSRAGRSSAGAWATAARSLSPMP